MLLPVEGNPAIGAGMLLTLGYAVYWVVRSRRRIRTALYALASMVVEILIAGMLTWLLPVYSDLIGTLAVFFAFIVMAITAAEHARFTIRRSQIGGT
jgi:predicted permease